ncbi:MAG: hypothetical protein QNK89_02460 [Lacinutrix sp.]|uniref:hypothetical protein n=1 Tax=Lacinutrix sp. TaxID=1937692 RepID=UPI0030B57BCE|tara:strand:- start:517 stop:942 length:426 start_codon:yes stop_codon:yes gene_type:complete
MKSVTITNKVKNGRLNENQSVVKALKNFEGKIIEIVIRLKKKNRSISQNSYYWAVIIPVTIQAIADEWGEHWDREKAHDFYKMHFLQYEIVTNDNKIIKAPKSTTENNTHDQEVFHKQCRDFIKEYFNVDIPLPNENIKFE